jgi:hypothetical protein
MLNIKINKILVFCSALIVLTSCTEPTTNSLSSPSSRITPTQQTTALESIQNKIIYEKDNTLYATDFNLQKTTQIAKGPKIGYVGIINEGKTIFFSTVEKKTFSIFKKNITEENAEKIFSFEGSDKNIEFYNSNTQINSEGTILAYSFKDGLGIYNIQTKQKKQIAANKPCLGFKTNILLSYLIKPAYAGGQDCYEYHHPTWVENSKYIQTSKILYEGSTFIYFDPTGTLLKNITIPPTNTSPDQTKKAYIQGYDTLIVSNSDGTDEVQPIQDREEYRSSTTSEPIWINNTTVLFSFNAQRDDSYGLATYNTTEKKVEIIKKEKDTPLNLHLLPNNKVIYEVSQESPVLFDMTTRKEQALLPKQSKIITIINN